jgi:hypothetical protein
MKRVSKRLAPALAFCIAISALAASAASATTYNDVMYYNNAAVATVREQGNPFFGTGQVGVQCGGYHSSGGVVFRTATIRPPLVAPLPGISTESVRWRGLLYNPANQLYYYNNTNGNSGWIQSTTTSTAGTEFGGGGDFGASFNLYSSAYWAGGQSISASGLVVYPYVQVQWYVNGGWNVSLLARIFWGFDGNYVQDYSSGC